VIIDLWHHEFESQRSELLVSFLAKRSRTAADLAYECAWIAHEASGETD
jgi:hypothetical protein